MNTRPSLSKVSSLISSTSPRRWQRPLLMLGALTLTVLAIFLGLTALAVLGGAHAAALPPSVVNDVPDDRLPARAKAPEPAEHPVVLHRSAAASSTVTGDAGGVSASPMAYVLQGIAPRISRTGSPDPVRAGEELFYTQAYTADLRITKSGLGAVSGTTTEVAGNAIVYTMTVTNDGPDLAQNVQVVDVLPAGLVEGSIDVFGPGCTVGTPGDPDDPLVCQLGDLAASNTVMFYLQANIDPSFVADQPDTPFANTLKNDVSVTSDTFDDDTSLNRANVDIAVTASADLLIGKEGNPGTVTAGEHLSYQIDVSNLGPSTAEQVLVTDTLPSEVTFQSATVVNGTGEETCAFAAGENAVTCSLGNVLPLATPRVLIEVLVDPSTPAGTITNNTRVVSVRTTDPGVFPNTATVDTTVSTQADLKIEKASEPDKVYAGEQMKYTITVTNLGPSDALTVMVTDTLPSEVTYEIDTGLCDESGGEVTCDLGTIVAGQSKSVDIWARVDAATTPSTVITNAAEVTGSTTLGDPSLGNNTATAEDLVLGKADLKITKFGKPDGQVQAGDYLTYTVIVENLGPGFANSVVVTDTLVSSGDFQLVDVNQIDRPLATCNPTSGSSVNQRLDITCQLAALEPKSATASGRWTIEIVVMASQTQDINNVAEVVSSDLDPDMSNNQATVEHDITDVSDLEITKTEVGEVQVDGAPGGTVTLIADQVTAGRSLTYILTITNNGPSTAENVVLQDRLPPWIVVTDITPSQGSCNTGTPGEPLDKLTCGLGTLAPDTSATVTIIADVPSWVPDETILGNDAFVYSDIFDDTNANNYATNLTGVSAFADLSVTKIGNPNPVVAGELLEYTVTITNTGPSDAIGVVAVDLLPQKVEFVRIRDPYATGVVCSLNPIDDHTLICVVGDMPVGDTLTFMIVVQVAPDAPSALDNHISVSSDTADPNPGDNDDDEGTGTERAQQLFVTKSDSPDPVMAGNELRYTITFGNSGPSEATNVVVTDTLPLGVIFNRCESLDPDDQVACSVIPGDGITTSDIVRVEEILDGITVVYTANGKIDVGDSFAFLLIADVESGYVLNGRGDTGTGQACKSFFDATGYSYFAHNRAGVSADLLEGDVVVGQATDYDDECTRVNAEADLELTMTDTPETELIYDPVSNSFVFDYILSVRNNGPSASAVALFTDTLPVDAEFISWMIPSDMQCIFHDDGTVFCLAGNAPNNEGVNEPGRLDAGSEVNFTIRVRVDSGSSPRTLVNQAEVWSVNDDDARVYFSIPDVYPDDATPSLDPDLSNNVQVETTTVLNARVRVDKRAFLGDTAGLSPTQVQAKCETDAVDDLLVLPNTQVTYCYFIYDEGDTWLNEVELTDTPSGHMETASGSFVSIIGREGTNSDFTTAHALWASVEGELAPLAPAGEVNPDGYFYLLATRTVTVDFPADSNVIVLGSNTATVTAVPTTKYSTTFPGVATVNDTDLLHDTLALPVLEDTIKKWDIYEDRDWDDQPSPRDVIEYVVDIPNTGIIEATGVEFYDGLYNYISGDPEDLRVPGLLINGSVSAAIHVYGRDPVTGDVIDADLQPPDLAFGEDLLLRTYAPAIGDTYLELTYLSAIELDSEILKGNNSGDDEVQVATRLAIPPVGYLLRFDGVTYDPPIPVTFSLRVRYQVRIKETEHVRLGTIVLNHGWVTYDEMALFDQRFPSFDPANPDAHTAANKVANNHTGTPARAWERPEFPGWPEMPVDVEPTDYSGLRFDDYAQPRAALRDNDDDPTWFKLEREPRRIQLPAIDNQDGWETQIQVQNGGDDDLGAIVFFWGEYSGVCPYSDPGPVGSVCKRVLENAVWPLKTQGIPSTAKSAIVYSVDKDLFDDACRNAADAVDDSAAWRDWEDDYEDTGEPIAVIVQRQGPNDHGTVVASAYPGISENMTGGGPVYQYFAPYAMRQYYDLDTEIIIHNSGQDCAGITLGYQKQDDCIFSYEEDIELAPGESVRRRVPEVLGSMWLGSIYVESDEPLGIVIDQTSFLPSEDRGALLTYEARPYKLTTDTLFYAALVWRELSGWDASIQVQNLTQESLPTFVTVEFFDQSGDSILFLGDWVCRAGGATFYLPAVTDLGMEYAGAAVIQSHSQVDYPGREHDGQPIFAVVDLKKTRVYDEALHRWRPTVPGEIQGGGYNALAENEKKEAGTVLLPFLAKARDYEGKTSLIAVRNNSNCNNIALRLEIRNRTGTVVSYTTDFWLSPGHIKLIDLANVGSVNPGFVGAGTVEVTDVYQLCDVDSDGSIDEEPTMLSVVVVNKGAGSGDITSVYEGISIR